MIIPKEQLNDLGFIEIKENLFMNELPGGIKLYRDYRNEPPVSYAYRGSDKINYKFIREYQTITKIERQMDDMKKEGEL